VNVPLPFFLCRWRGAVARGGGGLVDGDGERGPVGRPRPRDLEEQLLAGPGASETRLWTEDDDASAGEELEKPAAPASARRQKPGGGGASGQGFCLLIQGFRGFSKST